MSSHNGPALPLWGGKSHAGAGNFPSKNAPGLLQFNIERKVLVLPPLGEEMQLMAQMNPETLCATAVDLRRR